MSVLDCQYKTRVKVNGELIDVPCGYCRECRIKYLLHWDFRLNVEWKSSVNSYFGTYTYKDENIPMYCDPETGEETKIISLNKDHAKKLNKNLRQKDTRYRKKHPLPEKFPGMKYTTCGEYGTKYGRPHLHNLLFNLHPKLNTDKIQELWSHGIAQVKPLTKGGIRYVLKDMVKSIGENQEKRQNPFIMFSNKIGMPFVEKNSHLIDLDEKTISWRGKKIPLAKYYKNKLQIDEQFSPVLYNLEKLTREKQIKKLEAELKKLGYIDLLDYQDKQHETRQKRKKFFNTDKL